MLVLGVGHLIIASLRTSQSPTNLSFVGHDFCMRQYGSLYCRLKPPCNRMRYRDLSHHYCTIMAAPLPHYYGIMITPLWYYYRAGTIIIALLPHYFYTVRFWKNFERKHLGKVPPRSPSREVLGEKERMEHFGANNKMEHVCMSDKSLYETLVTARSSYGRND